MKLILTFKGPAELRSAALEHLSSDRPGIILTPKTERLIEAQLNPDAAVLLRASADWDALEPTTVSVKAPALGLASWVIISGFEIVYGVSSRRRRRVDANLRFSEDRDRLGCRRQVGGSLIGNGGVVRANRKRRSRAMTNGSNKLIRNSTAGFLIFT